MQELQKGECKKMKEYNFEQAYDILKIILGTSYYAHTEIVEKAEEVLGLLGIKDASILDKLVAKYEANHTLITVCSET